MAILPTLHATESSFQIRPGHPRLLTTDKDWGAMKRRIASYGEGGEALLSRLKVMADQALTQPMAKPVPAKGDWLSESRNAQRRLLCLSLAWRLFGNDAYLKRAVAETLHICGYENWHPEHFLDTGEAALTVALVYDWLHDALSPAEREAIRNGLMKNALCFAEAIYKTVDLENDPADRRLWWARRKNNWSVVCHTGLLAAALAMHEDIPDLAGMVVKGAVAYLPVSMRAYEPAGAYPEGPGYWGYGTTYNVVALAMLESAVGSDMGLAKSVPAFGMTAPYRLHMDGPTRLIFNYADSLTSWEDAISPAFVWLAVKNQQPTCVAFAWDRMTAEFAARPPEKEGNRFFPYYFFWLPPKPTANTAPLPLDAHYGGEADVATFRSAWGDSNALYLGFKAGFNGAGHGHLDQGSFVLDADGVRWSAELGSDSYGLPGYFGPRRWDYLRLNNLGHSTLLINREKQDPKAESPIFHFESAPSKAMAVADLSAAHPKLVKKWLRAVSFLDRSRVLVQDEIDGAPAKASFEWQMITPARIEVSKDGRSALLLQGDKRLEARILSPAKALFSIAQPVPADPKENANQGFSILVAKATAEGETTRIGVQLRPLGAKWPPSVADPVLEALQRQ